MNVPTTTDAAAWLGKYIEGADGDTDLAQAMLAAIAEALMSAEGPTSTTLFVLNRLGYEALR